MNSEGNVRTRDYDSSRVSPLLEEWRLLDARSHGCGEELGLWLLSTGIDLEAMAARLLPSPRNLVGRLAYITLQMPLMSRVSLTASNPSELHDTDRVSMLQIDLSSSSIHLLFRAEDVCYHVPLMRPNTGSHISSTSSHMQAT